MTARYCGACGLSFDGDMKTHRAHCRPMTVQDALQWCAHYRAIVHFVQIRSDAFTVIVICNATIESGVSEIARVHVEERPISAEGHTIGFALVAAVRAAIANSASGEHTHRPWPVRT